MRYLPHTKEDIEKMLKVTGHNDLDDLFKSVPKDLRTTKKLDIPDAMSEWELNSHMEELSSLNIGCRGYQSYMGGGSYDHFIPSIVPYLVSRSEFTTAYTPYQPEVSQGTLQGIYEFQTMITQLLDMDIATASHYDGGTALAEAALIALAKKRKSNKVAVSSLVHPYHRQIVATYLKPRGYKIVELPATEQGLTDLNPLTKMEGIAGVLIQSPNFFGNIENLSNVKDIADNKKILFIASFTEALAFGLLKPPGNFGVDIAAGEGQSLGMNKSFGGPGLGLLTGKQTLMRNLPGRYVGRTKDMNGDDGFVLTLATREQHIRREKASSNICSNNGLNAMTAAVYLSTIGRTGIREISQQNHDKAVYLKTILEKSGFKPVFDTPFFNEFVMKVPENFKTKRASLIQNQCIFAGLDLETFYPDLKDHYLFCATETSLKENMDKWVKEVG